MGAKAGLAFSRGRGIAGSRRSHHNRVGLAESFLWALGAAGGRDQFPGHVDASARGSGAAAGAATSSAAVPHCRKISRVIPRIVRPTRNPAGVGTYMGLHPERRRNPDAGPRFSERRQPEP